MEKVKKSILRGKIEINEKKGTFFFSEVLSIREIWSK